MPVAFLEFIWQLLLFSFLYFFPSRVNSVAGLYLKNLAPKSLKEQMEVKLQMQSSKTETLRRGSNRTWHLEVNSTSIYYLDDYSMGQGGDTRFFQPGCGHTTGGCGARAQCLVPDWILTMRDFSISLWLETQIATHFQTQAGRIFRPQIRKPQSGTQADFILYHTLLVTTYEELSPKLQHSCL